MSDDGSGKPTPLPLAIMTGTMLALLALLTLAAAFFFGVPLLDYIIQYWSK